MRPVGDSATSSSRQDRYDRLEASRRLPMLVLALAFLPVLLLPVVIPAQGR